MAEFGSALALETKKRVPTVLSIQVGETVGLVEVGDKIPWHHNRLKMGFFEQIRNTTDKDAARILHDSPANVQSRWRLSSRRRLPMSAA